MNRAAFCTAAATAAATKCYAATRVCVIGTGPAGFYTTMQLIKSDPYVHVDMYEKLAVPYGLVRYGVAPDHPEVKNCISSFNAVANKERCCFYGNVAVGKDITVTELREHYHAIVIASGAWQDRQLGILGEDDYVLSARQLVGWYNGLPQDAWLKPPLEETEHAVVVGQGNVALDVARILLTDVDKLRFLDIPEHVLSHLSSSRVRRVTLLGRRGPEHVACTVKELREMTKMDGVGWSVMEDQCNHLPGVIDAAPRPRRRLLELLLQCSKDSPSTVRHPRHWGMSFLRSPTAVLGEGGRATSLSLTVNRLDGDRAVATPLTESLQCQLVLRSIGYTGTQFDSALPYRKDTGAVENEKGRVTGMPGVYATGWAGSGPTGVIASTMAQSFAVAKTVLQDLRDDVPLHGREGSEAVMTLLKERGVSVVPLSGASRILQAEQQRGAALGKSSEKITSHQKMLDIAISGKNGTVYKTKSVENVDAMSNSEG